MLGPSGKVGVDVGASAVRVVVVSGTDDTSAARVERAASAPLNPGAVVGGRIKDVAAVAAAMDDAFAESGAPRYGCVVGLSSPEGAVSRVALPSTLKPSEWTAVVRTADRDPSYLLKLRDAALSLNLMRDVAPPEGQVMTLMGAVPRTDVATMVRATKMAKATPRAVDMVGAAVMRTMTRTYPGNTDVATVVDIGASKITVATRQGAYLRSVRTVPSGADDITRAVMGALDCQYREAEEYKRASRVLVTPPEVEAMPGESSGPMMSAYGKVSTGAAPTAKTADEKVAESVSVAAAALCDEIASCVEADSAKFSQNTTKGVVLCGGGALMRGMRDMVADRVGVPVMVGRPWATLVPGRHTEGVLAAAGGEEFALLTLATAVGLALWEKGAV